MRLPSLQNSTAQQGVAQYSRAARQDVMSVNTQRLQLLSDQQEFDA
jgi:hypothetical protein